MRFSRFFIDRPIFAVVLSIVIFVAGLLAMLALPISEYPEVVPPTVVVRALYPGREPDGARPDGGHAARGAINGVENMLYMSSSGDRRRRAQSHGDVRDRHRTSISRRCRCRTASSQALPRLPEEVRALGVTTEKRSPDITMVVHLVSPDGRYDPVYLRNYAVLHVKDELARIPGVGQVIVFGAGDYAMRVWLDPNKVASRGLSAGDVVQAIREQNLQVAAGVVGAPPMPEPVAYQLTRQRAAAGSRTRRSSATSSSRPARDGEVTRLRDVARHRARRRRLRAARAARQQDRRRASAIFQAPGSNALALSSDVRAKMAELKTRFPQGVDCRIVYDPTIFVRDSIHEVVDDAARGDADGRHRRRAVPADVAGVDHPARRGADLDRRHVRGDAGAGFSINTLSLFGLVLAIGIVVDDAIVVVENVERHIEEGLSPLEASHTRDGGGERPDHRDRARAVRGVRAGRVHQRADRPVLPAVRADDRVLDADLGVQLADAVAGAARRAAAAARRAAGPPDAGSSSGCSAGSSGRSTASSARPPTRYGSVVAPAHAPRRRRAGRCTRAWSCSAIVGFRTGAERIRARPRTSNISSRSRSCRMPRRSIAPRRS